MAFDLLLVFIVAALSCPGPGFLLARRLRLDPLETLTASIVLSLLVQFVASFAAFTAGLPAGPAHAAILVASGLLTLAALPGLRDLLATRVVRTALVWFAVWSIGVLAILSLIRGYSGGLWYGDWFEHFERSRFFLGGHDPGELFLGSLLPARPPLVNVLGAHALAIAGDRFTVYQLTTTLLCLPIFFPALLLARRLALARGPSPAGRFRPAVLAAFVLASPFVMQNATYCWTKLPAAFFVLAGLAFYLRGVRGDRVCLPLAFLSFAGGMASHYSAVPYALVPALHYLVSALRRPPDGTARRPPDSTTRPLPGRAERWREAGLAVAAVLIVLGPWVAYLLRVYGPGPALAANSTAIAFDEHGGGTIAVTLDNLAATMLPRVPRHAGEGPPPPGFSWAGLRDSSFIAYQQTLPFALGALGPALLIYAWVTRRRTPARAAVAGSDARLLAALVLPAGLLAVPLHTPPAAHGLAHVVLQPVVLLGIIYLAACYDAWARPVRLIVAAGLIFDTLLGIGLHVLFQSLPRGVRPQGIAALFLSGGPLGSAADNATLQFGHHAVFLGSALRGLRIPLALVAAAVYVIAGAGLSGRSLRGDASGR